MQGSLSVERMCHLVPVSRAGSIGRFRAGTREEEMEVRSAIQVAVEHRRRYGYRRVTAELRPSRLPVNHNAWRG